MIYGYMRVSTDDQKMDLQIDALKEAGCHKIYQDKISGTKKNRPGLDQLRSILKPGDTIKVYKLDRLGRSLKDLIHLVEEFNNKQVKFISINDNIDTTTPIGKFTFHLFGALAEFERNIISERTKAGLSAAKARGKKGGRPSGASDKQKVEYVKYLYTRKDTSVKEMCKLAGLSRATFYRYLRAGGVDPGK